MNDDIRTEKIIDALYTAITDSISDDVCHDCPVVQAIRDLRDTIHDHNYKIISEQLGIEIQNCRCPYIKK